MIERARLWMIGVVHIERICWHNLRAFGRRHRRYTWIAVALYAAGIVHWKKRRVLRTGFCFLQAVDDILDGDRVTDAPPLALVNGLQQQWTTQKWLAVDEHNGVDDLNILAQAFHADLSTIDNGTGIRAVSELMDVMKIDHKRMRNATLWRAPEIQAQHRRTFSLSVDLMLIAIGSPLRAAQFPELMDALGWCSTVRDLEEDIAHGLINVPEPIFKQAQQEMQLNPYSTWRTTQAIGAWLSDTRVNAMNDLSSTYQKLKPLKHTNGAGILKIFARSIEKY